MFANTWLICIFSTVSCISITWSQHNTYLHSKYDCMDIFSNIECHLQPHWCTLLYWVLERESCVLLERKMFTLLWTWILHYSHDSLQSSKTVNKEMKCKGSSGYPSSFHIKATSDHNLTWFLLFLLSLSCDNLTETELSVGTVLSYDSLDLITGHRLLECSDKKWALELDLCMCGKKWTSQGLEEEEQRRRQTSHRIRDVWGFSIIYTQAWPITTVVASKGHWREMVGKVDEWA